MVSLTTISIQLTSIAPLASTKSVQKQPTVDLLQMQFFEDVHQTNISFITVNFTPLCYICKLLQPVDMDKRLREIIICFVTLL